MQNINIKNMLEAGYQFAMGAVLNGNYYNDFGIIPELASMWGRKPEDIVTVVLEVAEDQILGDFKADEYWGWWDNKSQRFTRVFPCFLLLHVCFPYGIKVEEEAGKGKAYKLIIKEVLERDV